MAFDDELGFDASQRPTQDYTLNSTGLVTKTFNLWTRSLLQYIIIVGLIGAILSLFSFILVLTVFASIGILGTDPISYLFGLFGSPTLPDITVFAVSLGFAIIAFIMNAIVAGAAIKYTLDDYSGVRADIGESFAHSFGKVLRIMIVQVIVSLIVTASITPALVLTGLAMEGFDPLDPYNFDIDPEFMVLLMQAMVLLIIGGIIALYVVVRFAPTTAIVVDTDLSAIDSLKKSWELTSGNFWHVFVGQIVLGILVIILGVIVGLVTYLAYPYDFILTSIITSLLFGAFNYIFAVVLYRDLSSRRGSSSLDDLAVGFQ